jgi:hypothetical protein
MPILNIILLIILGILLMMLVVAIYNWLADFFYDFFKRRKEEMIRREKKEYDYTIVSCFKCKRLLYKKDAKSVEIMYSYPEETDWYYYCPECKPEYEIVKRDLYPSWRNESFYKIVEIKSRKNK